MGGDDAEVVGEGGEFLTGAGGAGAAAATYTCRLPVDVKRYVGTRIVSGASTADASSVAATLEALL